MLGLKERSQEKMSMTYIPLPQKPRKTRTCLVLQKDTPWEDKNAGAHDKGGATQVDSPKNIGATAKRPKRKTCHPGEILTKTRGRKGRKGT